MRNTMVLRNESEILGSHFPPGCLMLSELLTENIYIATARSPCLLSNLKIFIDSFHFPFFLFFWRWKIRGYAQCNLFLKKIVSKGKSFWIEFKKPSRLKFILRIWPKFEIHLITKILELCRRTILYALYPVPKVQVSSSESVL